jgi:predicted enzyme related to lactoylglutathione lyase
MGSFTFVSARPELGSRDLARSRVFWCDRLGFAVAVERPGFLVLRAGDAEIALKSDPDPSPARVFLHVRGVEAVHDLLVAAGTQPGELHTHESARRTFDVRDPDGHLVVLCEPPRNGGRVGWIDLTVPDAAPTRDFWRSVGGFDGFEAVDMGEYQDFSLLTDGRPIAGVCHARGPNAELPPVWLVYFTVDDLHAALAEVEQRGGRIVEKRTRMAVVQDPAGAIAALFQV